MDINIIYDKISNDLNFNDYKKSISSDIIEFDRDDGNCKYYFAVRGAYFGFTTMFNLWSNKVLNRVVEQEIINYIHQPLLNFYDSTKTISIGLKMLDIDPELLERFQGFEISNMEELQTYVLILKEILVFNEKMFFDKTKSINGIAQIMSKFSFSQRDEFSVGGTFPCQIIKKIIIFYLGGQMERYKEYCLGLEGLFELYAERKPDKKEELALFKEGYQYMKEKLNSSALPTENSCY